MPAKVENPELKFEAMNNVETEGIFTAFPKIKNIKNKNATKDKRLKFNGFEKDHFKRLLDVNLSKRIINMYLSEAGSLSQYKRKGMSFKIFKTKNNEIADSHAEDELVKEIRDFDGKPLSPTEKKFVYIPQLPDRYIKKDEVSFDDDHVEEETDSKRKKYSSLKLNKTIH